MKHAKLSASGSERWLNCPGSVTLESQYEAQYGSSGSSSYASLGTKAHELAEYCLTNRKDPETFIGVDNVDEDMARAVQTYVDYINDISSKYVVETELDTSHIIPDGFGTCDAYIIDNDHLHVIDYKHGQGVSVSAENNTQLLIYASAIVHHYYQPKIKIEKITIHIVQPRIHNINSWTCTIEELKIFEQEVKIKAAKALDPEAKRIPSEKACKWCKAKSVCPEMTELTTSIIASDFDDVSQLDDSQVKYILDNKKLILDHLNAIEQHAMQHPPRGYKIVAGRSNKKWVNESLVEELLKERAYVHKLISPAQALKLKMLPQAVKDNIVVPEGKPTLVPESDKRPALTDAFELIE